MKEMDELSAGIEKLKRNSDNQKRVIEALEKDRAFLMERTRFLGQKLSEAYVIYEEAGKRILDFVDKETAPIKNQIAELKNETKKLPDMEHELRVHSSSLSKIRATDQALKAKLAEAEKTLRKLNEMEASLKAYTQRMKESGTREEQAIDKRISEIRDHLETRVKVSDDKLSLKIEEASEEVLHDATDSMNALAASQHELKKRLGETALTVRALNSNSDSFRKYIHSAGLSRSEMEKKLSGSQASIRELESSISLIQKRLGSIGLEDERLEKRLSGMKKSAGQIIDSRFIQEKSHIENKFKRQDALLGERIRVLSGEIERKALAISGKVLLERKHADEMKAWLESRIKEFQKAERINQNRLEREIASARKDFRLQGSGLLSRMDKQAAGLSGALKEHATRYDSARKQIEKKLSLHQEVMRGMESSIGRLSSRLDSEGLEDEKLEARLSELRKQNEEMLAGKLAAVSGSFDSKLSVLSKRLDAVRLEDSKLEKRLSEARKTAEGYADSKAGALSESFDAKLSKIHGRLEGMKLDEASLDKKISEARKNAEEFINSKAGQLRSLMDSAGKRHSEALDSRIAKLSETLDARFSGMNERLGSIKLDENNLEKRLLDVKKAAQEFTDSRMEQLRERNESGHKRLAEILDSKNKALSESLDSKLSRIHERLDGVKLDEVKLEKRLSEVRKSTEEIVDSKASQFRSQMDSSSKKHLELIDYRIGKFSEGFDAKLSRIDKRMDSVNLEDEKLEKRLMDVKKAAQEFTNSRMEQLRERNESNHKNLTGMIDSKNKALSEGFDARFSRMNERFDGVKLDEVKLEKRLMDARKSTEELVGSLAGQLKSRMDSAAKRHSEILDSRVVKLSENFDAKFSKISQKMDSINLEDEKLEKRLGQTRKASEDAMESRLKAFSEDTDSRIGKISERLSADRSQADQARQTVGERFTELQKSLAARDERIQKGFQSSLEKLSERLDSMGMEDEKLEKRLSSLRAGLEESMNTGLGRMKSYSDAGQKKQTGLAISGMKAIADDLEGKISRLNERLSSEKRDMESIESMVDRKMEGIQKGLYSKVSSLDALFEKKVSQVYSHVSSEKKALAELKSGLEREIGEHQKSLSARVAGLAEKSESRLARLSQEVALERKALGEEKARFTERVASVNQALSKLNEFSRSTDSRLKEFSKLYLDKLQDSQLKYTEGIKELSQRFKSLEMTGKVSSSQSSGLNRQLIVLESSKISMEKRLSEADSRLNRLESSVPGLDSSSKTAFMELRKHVELLATKNASLNEQLVRTNQTVQKILEAGRSSEQRIHSVSSDTEDTEKRIKELENALRMLSERLSKQNILTMNSDMEGLRKEIAEWKSEQSRLYDMLKED